MAQSAKVRIGEKISWPTDNIEGATKAEAVRRDAGVVVGREREGRQRVYYDGGAR